MFLLAILTFSWLFLSEPSIDVWFVLLSAALLVDTTKILLPEGVVSLVGPVPWLCKMNQAVYIL